MNKIISKLFMYDIICYEENKSQVSTMYNYFSKELNEIKNDKNIHSYLLIHNYKIYGIFSFKYNKELIEIVLFKTIYISDTYLKEFICRICNNILLDFENIYINTNKISSLDFMVIYLNNYNYVEDNTRINNTRINNTRINNTRINNIEKNNIENNKKLHYKKKHRYNYFNCLFY